MPRAKRDPHDWPSLNAWLLSIDISETEIREYFFYSALVDYFPGSKNGSNLVPTGKEIEKEKSRLKRTIIKFNPEIVVSIGKLSLSYCLGRNIDKLDNFIGGKYYLDPYGALGRKVCIIPLPHPSGASTWRHKPENKILLQKALNLLRTNLF